MTLIAGAAAGKACTDVRDKGRIRVAADADITIFEPEKVIDKATFEDPLQPSEGIRLSGERNCGCEGWTIGE